MSRLHYAARLGQYDEVIDCLAQGENVNAFSVHHFSALMLAAQHNHLHIVKLLLKAGADIHLSHFNRRTALHLAAGKGHLEIVTTLAASGADVDAVSGFGCTPAIEAAMFTHREVVDYLRTHGADLSLRCEEGYTADEWLEIGGVFWAYQETLFR